LIPQEPSPIVHTLFISGDLLSLILVLTPLAHHAPIPAGIQRACLHPLMLCLSTNPFLCHPFFGFGQHGLIRHASSEKRTIVFLLPRQ
jgi:hypothetical protein